MPKITMKAARINAGLSQAEIADKMGISREFYNNIETGKVTARPVYIYGFCQITGFSTNDIILPSVTTKVDN